MKINLCMMMSALFVFGVGVAGAQPAGIQMGQVKSAPAWVDAEGMTLYVSGRDTPGVSTCDMECTRRWQPLVAQEGGQNGAFRTIRRPDGTLQWSYQGWPLYRWVLDLSPGQATGDGVGGVWRVARPAEEEGRKQ
jgi:predicted lipoprotein with Yx(FWY)xxD motif